MWHCMKAPQPEIEIIMVDLNHSKYIQAFIIGALKKFKSLSISPCHNVFTSITPHLVQRKRLQVKAFLVIIFRKWLRFYLANFT